MLGPDDDWDRRPPRRADEVVALPADARVNVDDVDRVAGEQIAERAGLRLRRLVGQGPGFDSRVVAQIQQPLRPGTIRQSQDHPMTTAGPTCLA